MTITDLKSYAERINEQYSPLDRMQITLRRDALASKDTMQSTLMKELKKLIDKHKK